MRTFILLSFILVIQSVLAQLPTTLVTSRSIVVMDLPLIKDDEYMTRKGWEEQAASVQRSLSVMGVDAIAYLHSDDWNASPASKSTFQSFFQKRQVVHVVILSKNKNNIYELSIKRLDDFSSQWETTGGSLNQALFRLGKEIKIKKFVIENFLSSSEPEIVTDVPFSKWTASTSFPDQIKRMTIGVARFESEGQNEELKRLLGSYPFKYELFDYIDDEDAYRKGYQFILVHMGTAGKSIKNLLNYRTGLNETDYISTVAADSRTTRLKKIPVDAFVHKFYFRQTVNHEAYVGKKWDVDVTWQKSLANFILNLRIAFRRI